MTVLNRNPINTNPLQPTKFLLTFSRIPDVQYFCQQVNVPGVELDEMVRHTPFLDMYSPGTKLKYDPFDVNFIVDEEMNSWKNLYNWFISIADPDGFEKRNDLSLTSKQNLYLSDAILTVLSALNNPILRIEYRNVYPITMSDLEFNTQLSADTIMTCKSSFRYESYNYLTV